MTAEENEALACLDGIADRACCEMMRQTILRGFADSIKADADGVLLRNRVVDITMIAAKTKERLYALAEEVPLGAPDVLLCGCADEEDAQNIRRQLHLSNMIPFLQYAYYGEMPAQNPNAEIRVLGLDSLDFLYENYGHLSKEYMQERIERGVMLGAYIEGELAGFIGEHNEGSVGLLHIVPAFRRMHLGYTLESAALRRTMLAGETPFCQVVPDNAASISLQARLGMTLAEGYLYWLTDDTL